MKKHKINTNLEIIPVSVDFEEPISGTKLFGPTEALNPESDYDKCERFCNWKWSPNTRLAVQAMKTIKGPLKEKFF